MSDARRGSCCALSRLDLGPRTYSLPRALPRPRSHQAETFLFTMPNSALVPAPTFYYSLRKVYDDWIHS